MNKKTLKWTLWVAAPLMLILPFSGIVNIGRYFKTIIIQPQKTGITTLNLYDDARSRPIVTEVWYPVHPDVPSKSALGFWIRCDEARDAPLSNSRHKYPLIIMSHGLGGDRFNTSWLAEVLAANGYIVAAMDHWGNTWNNKIPECYARPWDRPQDITFVLNHLISNSNFKDLIDTKRIGFTGYSLGGATGIWVAGAQAGNFQPEQIKEICQKELAGLITPEVLEKVDFSEAFQSFHDNRIKAAFIMAPALGWFFGENTLESINIPVHIVAPEKDPVVPAESNAKIFAKKIAKAKLKMLFGDANHYIFLSRASNVGQRFLEPKLFKDPESIDRKQVHEELAKEAVQFFDSNLR